MTKLPAGRHRRESDDQRSHAIDWLRALTALVLALGGVLGALARLIH